MPIAPNTSFDHYEIIAPLGKGGMGEVYRARDTRLNREVAIKVLPAEFAQDADRLSRFEQEARATSALNHPNILTVYDFGSYEGNPYLVMELLEGEELRAQLDEGALPVRKAIEYAQQMTAGLAAAHEKGIVHRDLKPENLFITKDGRLKILDFGLAKLRPPRTVSAGSDVATQKQLTNPGTVMGTVAYMSPEQVRGQDLDYRSDIFSFGIILYEMLSGQRAFTGELMADVMSAIMRDDPPELSETNAKISPSLDKIVRRCLEKKPEMRFHSAHDLGFALSTLTTPSGSRLETATALPAVTASLLTKGMFGNARLAWIAAAVLLLGLLAALPFAVAHLRHAPPTAAIAGHFTIVAPEQVSSLNQLAISPDGRNVAFIGGSAGKTLLWVRPIDSLTARPLPGTEGSNLLPFWSPDSRAIAFYIGGKLKKIDLADGTQQTLCDIQISTRGFSGTWNRAGDILIFSSPTIYRVAATGGTPTPVPGLDPKVECRWPWFLPDGQHFLYLASSTQQENAEVFLASLDGKVNRRLLASDSSASYAASATGEGWLFFVRGGTLLAHPFDARRLALTGEPVRVAASVQTSPNRRGLFSVSDSGTVVYQPSRGDESAQLAWVDRAGTPGYIESPKLSPDGKQVVVSRRELSGNADIYVIDLARNVSTRLTFDPDADDYPIWSPDGSRIVWYSRREGNRGLYQKLASGTGQDELLLKSDALVAPSHWPADGKFIAYTRVDPQTKADLWVLPLDAGSQPVPFLQTPFAEWRARFSPDGRWIAYQSDESGMHEIYVQTFPASGGKWQVSTQGGSQSYWRGDGKELYYISGDGKLMAVAVNSGSTFAPGLPQVLFDLKAVRPVPGSSYTVTNDGQRFLFVRQAEETNRLQYNVVVNWMAEVKK